MPYSFKTEKICQWGTRILIFLVPVLPLYISAPMVFPYITGKNFAFRILVEVAAFFWIGLITVRKEYRPAASAMVASVLTFTFVTGMADLLGVNPYNSFWSSYERMEGYITILHLALYFMIVRSVLKTRKDWLMFFNIISAVGFLVGLHSLSAPAATEGTRHWLEYNRRIYGTIGNPPFLAAYSLLTIFTGLMLLLNTPKKYLKIYYAFLVLLNTAVIYRTATRGAILAGVVGLLIMLAYYIIEKVKTRKWKLINTAVASVVVICAVALAVTFIASRGNYSLKTDATLSRFSSMLSNDSVRARLNSWEMAWNGIKERPVLGWGQENFIGIYAVSPMPYTGEQVWTDRAHNIVIEWLINAGVLGLSSYMAIMGTALYIVRKKYHGKLLSGKESITLVTALIVYFVQNLFTFDTINTYFIYFALLAYIDVVGSERGDARPQPATDAGITGIKAFLLTPVMMLVLSAIIYFANYRPMNESVRISRIARTVSEKSLPALLGDFRKTLRLNTFGDYDVRGAMESVSNYIVLQELFSREGAVEFVNETVVELERGISKHHHNLEYLTKVIKFYNRLVLYDPAFIPKAEALVRACMKMNPRYEWLNYALAEIYKQKKEYGKMYEIINNMADRDPLNDQKQFELALTAIFLKKEDVAQKALNEINRIRGATKDDIASGKSLLETGELNYIVKAYQKAKDFQKVIHYLNLLNIINPDHARVHFNLANAYLNLGDEAKAVEELDKAAKLDPSGYGGYRDKLLRR
ncbi:MAG: O-antigen ligase family protein [Nitrospirae bacterium]|nr:O-antigen ligase family protein [Nitrospirota bacterium]